MAAKKSREREVADAGRLEQFLGDPVVSDALSHMERRYYEEFKAAKTLDELQSAQARARVLDDFQGELRIVKDAGTRAAAEIAHDERRAGPSNR